MRRRAAALALVTTALALVTTALATAFMAVSAVNPIEAVWILAVGFAIAVVVDVVEALFARFLASFGTAAGVVTASVAVRGAVFTARCAVLAVYPIEAVGVLAVSFPVAVVVLLVEAGFAGFLYMRSTSNNSGVVLSIDRCVHTMPNSRLALGGNGLGLSPAQR